VKTIPLTQGKVALVDDEDYEWLSQYRWSYTICGPRGGPYATACINSKKVYMHRVIQGMAAEGLVVDHINRDGLDNRRSNLRCCTVAENNRNMSGWGKTGFKGVKRVRDDAWVAKIQHNKLTRHIGTFRTPEEAAEAYKREAKKLHGEFAADVA